jgi:hypothetical protein
MKQHFFSVRRPYFLVLLFFPLADAADSLLKGWTYFVDLGWFYAVGITVFFLACVAGVFRSSERYHKVLVIMVYPVLVGMVITAALFMPQ